MNAISLSAPGPEIPVTHDHCVRVEVWHDVNAFTGREGVKLEQVFECCAFEFGQERLTDDRDSEILEAAFETFNVGTSAAAELYRARGLRSLSVGDVVIVDGRAYACDSYGWTRKAQV